MKNLLILISLFILTINLLGQVKNRPIIWFGPSDSVKVSGINISPLVFEIPINTTINGINIDGIGLPFFLYMMPKDPIENMDSVIIRREYNINGITISPTGLIIPGTLNGIAITPWMTWIDRVNGLHICGLPAAVISFNGLGIALLGLHTFETKGIVIGAFNEAKIVKGLQIGILNKTVKHVTDCA